MTNPKTTLIKTIGDVKDSFNYLRLSRELSLGLFKTFPGVPELIFPQSRVLRGAEWVCVTLWKHKDKTD